MVPVDLAHLPGPATAFDVAAGLSVAGMGLAGAARSGASVFVVRN